MIEGDALGWFVEYDPHAESEAITTAREIEEIEIIEVFDFIDSLYIDGDDDAVQRFMDESFVTKTQKETSAKRL